MPYKNKSDEIACRARAYARRKNDPEFMQRMADNSRDWRKRNPDIVKEQKKRYTKKHLEAELVKIHEWKKKNPERAAQAARELTSFKYWVNPEVSRLSARERRIALKKELIAAYGGRCKCCAETRQEFMTIDHVKGGGRKHTKSLGLHGAAFHDWLRREGYPQEDYRLLCISCNFSIGHFGYCPHEREADERRELLNEEMA